MNCLSKGECEMPKNNKKPSENDPEGYRGALRERLTKEGIRTWGKVRIIKGKATYDGLLLPRSQHTSDNYVTLKVDTGYNLGVLMDQDTKIERVGSQKGNHQLPHVDL